MYLIQSTIDILPIVSFSLAVVGFLPQFYEHGFVILFKKPSTQTNLGNFTWIIWTSSSIVYGVYSYFLHKYIESVIQLIFTILLGSVFVLRLLKPNLLPSSASATDISDIPSNTIIDISNITTPNSDFNETV